MKLSNIKTIFISCDQHNVHNTPRYEKFNIIVTRFRVSPLFLNLRAESNIFDGRVL